MAEVISRRTVGFGLKNALIYLAALVWLTISIYPFVFLVQNSFKGGKEFYMGNVWDLPAQLSFNHYVDVIHNGFFRFFFNSGLVVSVSLFLLLLTASLAAYGLSRIKFRYRDVFYFLFVGGMTIPVHIVIIPVYLTTRQLGIYDTLLSLIGPFVAISIPITIFILVAFMEEIPLSLEEAAHMDGASRLQIFRHVILPVSSPPLTAVGILNAVVLWNEFIFPLVLINSVEKRPLTLALWNFQGQYTANIPAMMTVLILSSLPLFLAYAFVHERLMEGIVVAAVKG
jgi:raffinose/stachyose/melibiose transport system permease protein